MRRFRMSLSRTQEDRGTLLSGLFEGMKLSGQRDVRGTPGRQERSQCSFLPCFRISRILDLRLRTIRDNHSMSNVFGPPRSHGDRRCDWNTVTTTRRREVDREGPLDSARSDRALFCFSQKPSANEGRGTRIRSRSELSNLLSLTPFDFNEVLT